VSRTADPIFAESLPRRRPLSEALPVPVLTCLALLALAMAVSTNFGQFHPQAMPWLVLAIAFMLLALRHRNRNAAILDERTGTIFWTVAIAAQAMLLLMHDPIGLATRNADAWIWFRGSIAAGGLFAIAALWASPRVEWLCKISLLVAYLTSGVIVLQMVAAPGVDVVVFQQQSCDALLRGICPYSITFPDISPAGSDFYGAGLSQNGRLLFGYPYPPLSLFLVLPAHLLGDFRLASLLATVGSSALLMFSTRAKSGTAAAAMLLLTPMGFFVLWAGWTEPLAGLMLVMVVVACRGQDSRQSRIARAVSLGLLLAMKQYIVLLLPLIPLIAPPGRRWRLAVESVAIAAAVSLPLALWDAPGFLHSVVLLQFHQPFRDDSLSFLAPLHGVLPATLAAAIPFAVVTAAIALLLRLNRHTRVNFPLAASAVLLLFFAFNKQAFCNYYHLVIVGLCAAIMPWESASQRK
jgi:hypothetical protein